MQKSKMCTLIVFDTYLIGMRKYNHGKLRWPIGSAMGNCSYMKALEFSKKSNLFLFHNTNHGSAPIKILHLQGRHGLKNLGIPGINI